MHFYLLSIHPVELSIYPQENLGSAKLILNMDFRFRNVHGIYFVVVIQYGRIILTHTTHKEMEIRNMGTPPNQ